MKKFITANPFLYTAGLAFVFLAWLLISLSFGENALLFPTPAATIGFLGNLLGDSYIYRALGNTLLRTLTGFGIALALALLLGSIAGEFKAFRSFLKPLLIVFKSAPTAAFVFLFLVLSGSSKAPIWIVVLLAFPILYESVSSGVAATEKDYVEAASIDGANKAEVLFHIKFPLALPYVALGLLSSFALSFKTTIMAEIIAGDTRPGLGSAIVAYRALDPTDLTPIFAIALLAIIVVLFFDLLTFIAKKTLKVE